MGAPTARPLADRPGGLVRRHPPGAPDRAGRPASTNWPAPRSWSPAAGSNRVVLTHELLEEARFGAQSALPIVDLALSSDVAPDAGELPGVDLIGLEAIGEHAPPEAATAMLEAQDIVAKAAETFRHIEGGRAADPAVIAMRAHVMGIIECEQALVGRKYPPEVAEAVVRSLRRVSNSLMHTPSLRGLGGHRRTTGERRDDAPGEAEPCPAPGVAGFGLREARDYPDVPDPSPAAGARGMRRPGLWPLLDPRPRGQCGRRGWGAVHLLDGGGVPQWVVRLWWRKGRVRWALVVRRALVISTTTGAPCTRCSGSASPPPPDRAVTS